MKHKTLWKKFLADEEYIAKIAELVVDQMGGLSADTLQTLYGIQNGADGYTGFIYYSECFTFWTYSRDVILPFMEEQAFDLGEKDAWNMVHSFNVFKRNGNELKNRDLAMALYGDVSQCEDNYLISVLCWYALEEVAYRFHEWLYDKDIDLDNIK